MITTEEDGQDLVSLNRLDVSLKPRQADSVAKITAIMRSMQQRRHSPEISQEELVQRIRSELILQAEDEERWNSQSEEVSNG